MNKPIQIVSAPSILGLTPSGVEKLSEQLLSHGLAEALKCNTPVVKLPVLNSKYNKTRDQVTHCLNPETIRHFSSTLSNQVSASIKADLFPLVLGGDCSILIGIMHALKAIATYGLVFCDAHADFYEPEKSVTGQVADMDLAIVTGRGPELLTNINNQRPYVADEHVIHVGQRDWDETQQYGSQDVRDTSMHRIDYEYIKRAGISRTIEETIEHINNANVEGFWIHFDTDVLSDEENPAVDYRIAGGISFDQFQQFLTAILKTNKMAGMSVTIFNPGLDDEKATITKKLVRLLKRSLL